MSKHLSTLAALAVGMATAAAEARGKPFIPSGLLDGLKTASEFASCAVSTVEDVQKIAAEAVTAVDKRADKLEQHVADFATATAETIATLREALVKAGTEAAELRGELKRAHDDTALVLDALEAVRGRLDALEAPDAEEQPAG